MHHLDLDHSNHIWEGVKIIDLMIMTFSLASCCFHPSWKVHHGNWFCLCHQVKLRNLLGLQNGANFYPRTTTVDLVRIHITCKIRDQQQEIRETSH